MELFPFKTQTLVSSLKAEQLHAHLKKNVQALGWEGRFSKAPRNPYYFQGQINSDHFTLSKKLKHPDNFIPLIKGSLEKTATGTILFLRYELFPSTKLFLGFWTILTLFLSLVLFLPFEKSSYALYIFLAGCLNFAFTWLNFNRRVKQDQKKLEKMLNDAPPSL